MYFYNDRILIQILAFSLAPILGLMITPFSNPGIGLFTGVAAFLFIFFQPYFSELCLKNTAKGLGLNSIICAEGQIVYLGKNTDYQGKLFLTKDSLVFVLQNKIDINIPLKSIKNITISQERWEDIGDLESMLNRKSPNLVQVTNMVNFLANQTVGFLIIQVKGGFFSSTFCFQVTKPTYWYKKIISLINIDEDFKS